MPELCALCNQDANFKCMGCGKVLYCGDEHKKKHFTAHKAECKPYRTEKNNKYGRYLVTSRDVKQGELLIQERPLVVGPRVDSLPACLECFALLHSPSRCSVCKVSPLCDRCVHNDTECKVYAALSVEHKALMVRSSNQYVLPLRILLRMRAKDPDPRYHHFLEMEDHLATRKDSDVWRSHHINVVDLLQTVGILTSSQEDVDLVQKICGVLDVNSFEVRGAAGLAGMGMRLRGVYIVAALMAHDCITNVHLSVDDNFVMSVRASVDIKEGQPILYNYTDPLQPTSERQKHLREGKYFLCSCLRCSDPTELGTYMGAVRCHRCREGYILLRDPAWGEWACNHCGHEYSAGVITLTSMVAQDRLDSVDRTDPQQLESMLQTLSNTFSPTHSILLDVKQSIVAAYREAEPTRQNVLRKVELCRELLPVVRLIEPGISRLKGITLYELHVGLVTLGQNWGETALLREGEEVLREAVSMLLYEPTVSPEGELARQAMSELKTLKQIITKLDIKDKNTKKSKHKK